jgi:Raf kinase inhibitor-like YbhB/YbcL family protein
MTIEITTSAFDRGAKIPAKYTCDGDDASPPLAWTAGPEGTACYALIMDDPDAPGGTWVHWVAWNIGATRLAEALPKKERLPDGTIQGKNSWGKHGYGGPCPPSGEHRYFFKLYALDRQLELDASADKSALLAALKGHVLAEGQLLGVYARAKKPR